MHIGRILEAHRNKHDLKDLITRVGMIIPPKTKSIEKYFLDNIQEYEAILSRNPAKVTILKRSQISTMAMSNLPKLREILSRFTDKELFGIFGFYVIYNSRLNLIDNLLQGLYGLSYFIRFDEICKGDKTNIIIRYGCRNGESVIVTKSHLPSYKIHQLKSLRSLVENYSNATLISDINANINDKIQQQSDIWPISVKWLKCL